MKRFLTLFLVLLPVITFSQTVVIKKSHIGIGTKIYHGSEKDGRYQTDCVLEFKYDKPIVLDSAYDIEGAVDQAKSLKIFYTDDKGKAKVSNWIGKLPKYNEIKDKGSKKPKKAEEVEDAEPVVPKR